MVAAFDSVFGNVEYLPCTRPLLRTFRADGEWASRWYLPTLLLFHCRHYVRSDVRYIASFDPAITKGAGFVSSLALLAKFGKLHATATLQLINSYA